MPWTECFIVIIFGTHFVSKNTDLYRKEWSRFIKSKPVYFFPDFEARFGFSFATAEVVAVDVFGDGCGHTGEVADDEAGFLVHLAQAVRQHKAGHKKESDDGDVSQYVLANVFRFAF